MFTITGNEKTVKFKVKGKNNNLKPGLFVYFFFLRL